ncbi:MAG: cytochrome c1 [Nevskiales bacterium]
MKLIKALLILASTAPFAALASSGHGPLYPFQPDLGNEASLQRGAAAFMNYCAGCHSLKYLRYNRLAADLNIPEDILKKNLMFTSDKVGDTIRVAMPANSKDWFGQVPPDLSLAARARGPDWVYSYLKTFYLDSSKPLGVNNLTLPGASMPHVLGHLQGWQVLKEEPAGEHGGGHGSRSPLELPQPGTLTPAEYDRLVADLTNFLVYAAEPARLKRYTLGIWVMLFLTVFTVLAYLLKREYWKDVH